MDLVAAMRTLRRRWILTTVLLLLTLAATAAIWVKKPGPYQAESMVALIPSHQSSIVNGNNPYLSFGGSENIAGDIVLRQMMAPQTVASLADRGYGESFEIVDDPTTSGPILDITVTGSNQNEVEATLQGVTAATQAKLTALQSGLRPADQITSMVASQDPSAHLLVSKKARLVVLVLGLGLILTYAIPQIVDAEITRRRGRRGGRRATPPDFVTSAREQWATHTAEDTPPATREPAARPQQPVARPQQPAGGAHQSGPVRESQPVGYRVQGGPAGGLKAPQYGPNWD
jgi:hypothetical protein